MAPINADTSIPIYMAGGTFGAGLELFGGVWSWIGVLGAGWDCLYWAVLFGPGGGSDCLELFGSSGAVLGCLGSGAGLELFGGLELVETVRSCLKLVVTGFGAVWKCLGLSATSHLGPSYFHLSDFSEIAFEICLKLKKTTIFALVNVRYFDNGASFFNSVKIGCSGSLSSII